MRLSVSADSNHPHGKREAKYPTTPHQNGAGCKHCRRAQRGENAPTPTRAFFFGGSPPFLFGPRPKRNGVESRSQPPASIRKAVKPTRLPGLFQPAVVSQPVSPHHWYSASQETARMPAALCPHRCFNSFCRAVVIFFSFFRAISLCASRKACIP